MKQFEIMPQGKPYTLEVEHALPYEHGTTKSYFHVTPSTKPDIQIRWTLPWNGGHVHLRSKKGVKEFLKERLLNVEYIKEV